mmetsp:Transcript_68766/g.157759  ORF Transcript_68766/g.157759 Transcript_68766/m.157759 type:complete len:193 (+) Transcript_68766:15-593(+)
MEFSRTLTDADASGAFLSCRTATSGALIHVADPRKAVWSCVVSEGDLVRHFHDLGIEDAAVSRLAALLKSALSCEHGCSVVVHAADLPYLRLIYAMEGLPKLSGTLEMALVARAPAPGATAAECAEFVRGTQVFLTEALSSHRAALSFAKEPPAPPRPKPAAETVGGKRAQPLPMRPNKKRHKGIMLQSQPG